MDPCLEEDVLERHRPHCVQDNGRDEQAGRGRADEQTQRSDGQRDYHAEGNDPAPERRREVPFHKQPQDARSCPDWRSTGCGKEITGCCIPLMTLRAR